MLEVMDCSDPRKEEIYTEFHNAVTFYVLMYILLFVATFITGSLQVGNEMNLFLEMMKRQRQRDRIPGSLLHTGR